MGSVVIQRYLIYTLEKKICEIYAIIIILTFIAELNSSLTSCCTDLKISFRALTCLSWKL